MSKIVNIEDYRKPKPPLNMVRINENIVINACKEHRNNMLDRGYHGIALEIEMMKFEGSLIENIREMNIE